MKKVFYLLIPVLLLSSCYSTKDLNYIQSDDHIKGFVSSFHNKRTLYEVQPSDILSVRVQSLDPTQSAFFNIEGSDGRVGGGGQNADAGLYLTGYSVDERGYINLPIVGLVKVSSLTIDEVQRLIQKEISKYLIDAIVLVKLTSFKVSVLGDVARPGTYNIYNTRATLLEALSMAGDMNIGANRESVKVIRQIEDSGYVITLDLTDPKVLESPYYYLMPNDVVYVEILKQSTVRNNLPLVTVTFAGISTLILLLNYLDINSNNN